MHHACLNDHLERVKYLLSSTKVQLRSCNLVRLHTMCDTVGYYINNTLASTRVLEYLSTGT